MSEYPRQRHASEGGHGIKSAAHFDSSSDVASRSGSSGRDSMKKGRPFSFFKKNSEEDIISSTLNNMLIADDEPQSASETTTRRKSFFGFSGRRSRSQTVTVQENFEATANSFLQDFETSPPAPLNLLREVDEVDNSSMRSSNSSEISIPSSYGSLGHTDPVEKFKNRQSLLGHASTEAFVGYRRGVLKYINHPMEPGIELWFVADNKYMRAYQSKKDLNDELLELNLEIYEVESDPENPLRFRIIHYFADSPTGAMIFEAKDARDRAGWVRALTSSSHDIPHAHPPKSPRFKAASSKEDLRQGVVEEALHKLSDRVETRARQNIEAKSNSGVSPSEMRKAYYDAAKERKTILIRKESRSRILSNGLESPTEAHRRNQDEIVLHYFTSKDGVEDKYAVEAGTIELLVEHLADENAPDSNFIDALLLTHRNIITPNRLMELLVQRYNVILPPNPTPAQKEYYNTWAPVIKVRVLGVIKKWMDGYWDYDFNKDDEVKELLRDLLNQSKQEPEFKHLAERMLALVNELSLRADIKGRGEEFMKQLKPLKPTTRLEFFILDPVEFARQLTIVDSEKFRMIHPVEFMIRLWEGNSEATKNLTDMIQWFNLISYFTATEICIQPELKKREKLVVNFIKVAHECLKIRNFNATMAVLSGLNNSAVRRLKKTWSLVPPKILEILKMVEDAISSDNNFRNYRMTMAELDKRPNPGPCIPFLGLLLRDLTFLNDGNPKMLRRNLVNFAKLRRLAEPVLNLIKYQRCLYQFPTTRLSVAVQNYLRVPNAMTDQSVIYNCSLLCEPRRQEEEEDGEERPMRMIEKWQIENEKNQKKEDLRKSVLKEMEYLSTLTAPTFSQSPSVLEELNNV